MIVTVHSPSISVFEFKWYTYTCIYINTQCSLGLYFGKASSSLCFMKHFKEQNAFVSKTRPCVLMDMIVALT